MFWILTEPYSIKLFLLLNTAKLVKKQEKPSANRMLRFDVNNISARSYRVDVMSAEAGFEITLSPLGRQLHSKTEMSYPFI